ncbi:AraC family transcriptional regulator [Solimicrobium silvestre]|uniref:Helix-turn-helix domain n=1 Tax=Solimicrobium silvestre TaxID=2099400 RepID=A0A2S9GXM4_9BURK|nr:AraC family transcriptional regulator [Solimicrobium silvestre]PRC92472.1 Helix-turn-helix domain [Solimicrobium silvestre]
MINHANAAKNSPSSTMLQSLLGCEPSIRIADLGFVESLFDALLDVVFFVKDKQGRYLIVNNTLVRRCGLRSKEEMIGKMVDSVFAKPLAESFNAQDQMVITTGIALEKHLELHLYQTRERGWCLTHKIPLRDTSGAVVGLVGISQDLGLPDKTHPEYRQIASITDTIRENYHQDISISKLAENAKMPLARVERLFQKVFHFSPRQLLLQSRLNAALAIIESGDQRSIADIAYACGYTDHSAFSRQFKALIGMPPVEYRAHFFAE